jgi:RNA polymerase sigma-70 factor (ECF subfamily)
VQRTTLLPPAGDRGQEVWQKWDDMFFFDTNWKSCQVETEIPESEWVARAKRGDEDAFVQLALTYRPRVWSTASRFARSRPELEDLVQDLLVKIWKGLPTYRSDTPFENWVMTVTVRGCYDFLRKHRRRRENETLVDPQESRDSPDHRPERDRSRRDAWEIIRVLLDHLDTKDRTVITLLDLEERGVKETATLTGWSESNVKVRAHRARKKMRILYDELGLET